MPRIIETTFRKSPVLKAIVDCPPEPGNKNWRQEYEYFPLNGKGGRRRAERDANAWLVEAQKKRDLLKSSPSLTARKSFSEYAEGISDYFANRLAPGTYAHHETSVRCWLNPTFGEKLLDEITHADIDQLELKFRDQDRKPATIKSNFVVGRRIFNMAMRDGLTTLNPFENRTIKDPAAGRRAPMVISLDKLEILKRTCDLIRPGYGDLIEFLFRTLVRQGEAYALKCGDFDLENRRITVERAWSRGVKSREITVPKSGKARIIPIFDPVVPIVERLTSGRDPEEWFFAGERGHALWNSNVRQTLRWTSTVESLGLKGLRPHDLRHSGATWLAGSDVPLHVVQAILGHSSLAMTQVYLHADDAALDDAIKKIGSGR